MCGIAGQIRFDGRRVNLEELKVMTDAIAHRGPDGEGHWIDDEWWIGLGHRRLSIIDLSSAGCQPMHYGSRYTIIFNGEIYNYIEIREKLQALGYQFSSRSDTEVLLALYDHKKDQCLDDLDGMFAFVIYDKLEKKVFIARDRFGEKPFFYMIEDECLYFASEIKAFWALGLRKQADMETAFYYMHYGRVHHPIDKEKTFFINVKKLKAGHFITIDRGGLTSIIQQQYWKLPLRPLNEVDISRLEAESKFFELFKGSVMRRLRSDVPIGSSLSGGLDSSAVVCMIDYLNENKGFQQSTFSARFPGFVKDEGKYMEIVTKATHAKSFFTFPNTQGFVDDFADLCYFQDEPFGSASIYAQYDVMRLAKESGVTVLLDGQGADELLGGYSFYLDTLARENDAMQAKNANAGYRQGMIKFLKKTLPGVYQIYHSNQTDKNLITNLKAKGFGADFIDLARKLPVPEEIHESLHEHLCHDLTQGNLEDLLRYADRNSMAHGREVRLPFLDREFVEFVMSLPSSYKIREGWSKWIQRIGLESIVPSEITWRTDKIGYEPPQKDWMKDIRVQERIRESKKKLHSEGIITKMESEKQTEGVEANDINDNSWYQMMAANLFSNK